MGFRGGNRGGGGFRGGNRGGRGGGGRDRGKQDQGPPEEVVEFGEFLHECEGQLIVKSTNDKIPFFNAPIYLKNITQVGKIDEILGPITEYFVSIQLNDNYKASSFEKDQKLYIDPRKLLPLDRFLPKPPVPKEARKRKREGGERRSGGGDFKKFRDDKGGNRFGGSNRGGFSGNRDRGSFGKDRGSFGKDRGGRGGGFRGSSRGGGGFRGGSRGGRGGGRF